MSKKLILLMAGVWVTLILGASLFLITKSNSNDIDEPGAVCTQEAMMCPDGSGIGKSGKDCKFAECPSAGIPSEAEVNDTWYKLSGSLLAYRATRGSYPVATTAGWNDFVQFNSKSREPVVSPFTKLPYNFTSGDPTPGEIQYISPGSCADSGNDFRSKPRARDSFAVRMYYSSTNIVCKATL